MSLLKRWSNPSLAALIAGAGFRSFERFGEAVNHRGWEAYGLKLAYDHVSVRRWLNGGVCRHADVVADVLTRAWGTPVSEYAIWPELREAAAPLPPHQQPWVAARTLENLSLLIGGDMLNRREILAGAAGVVTGSALVAPIAKWLDVAPAGLDSLQGRSPDGTGRRIGDTDVDVIEASIRVLAARDAEIGGGLLRDSAVGELKQAVELVRYAHYRDPVGNRLLAAVAGLAGLVGWLSLDSGMPSTAQKYLLYGLQAARESTHHTAGLLAVRLLFDLAQHQRMTGHDKAAVRLADTALSRLPAGTDRYHLTRAYMLADRSQTLANLGPTARSEVDSSVGLAAELHDQAVEEERASTARIPYRFVDLSATELKAKAAFANLTLARWEPRCLPSAQEHNAFTLANPTAGHGRGHVYTLIRQAQLRFIGGEPELGCFDGRQALALATSTVSTMVTSRLRDMFSDTDPYADHPDVVQFRDQLRTGGVSAR